MSLLFPRQVDLHQWKVSTAISCRRRQIVPRPSISLPVRPTLLRSLEWPSSSLLPWRPHRNQTFCCDNRHRADLYDITRSENHLTDHIFPYNYGLTVPNYLYSSSYLLFYNRIIFLCSFPVSTPIISNLIPASTYFYIKKSHLPQWTISTKASGYIKLLVAM